jgi:hypothetical protein
LEFRFAGRLRTLIGAPSIHAFGRIAVTQAAATPRTRLADSRAVFDVAA